MIRTAAVLSTFVQLVLAQPVPVLRADHPLELEIRPTDEVLPGHGPMRWARFKVAPTGPLSTAFIWAEPLDRKDVRTTDFYLRVENVNGTRRPISDEDSGGGRVPYVEIEVREATEFEVAVACNSTAPATARLHLRVGHETDASLRDGEAGVRAVDDLRRRYRKLETETVRKRTRALARELLAATSRTPRLTQAISATAMVAWQGEDPETARDLWSREVESRSAWVGWCHPRLLWARTNYASALFFLGEQDPSLAIGQEVLEIWELIGDPDDPGLRGARTNAALSFAAAGKLDRAREIQQQIVDDLASYRNDEDGELQKARANLALTLVELGELDRGLKLQEKLVEVWTRTLRKDHPQLLRARGYLADTLFSLGRFDEAVEIQEEVLESWARVMDDTSPNLQRARWSLATTLVRLGEYQRGLDLQEKILDVAARTMGDRNPNTHFARLQVAGTLDALGRFYEAREIGQQALEALIRSLDESHPRVQTARGNLATSLRALGDFDRAVELQERVLADRERTLEEGHPDRQRARTNLADTLFVLGDLDRALELHQKVLEIMTSKEDDKNPELQRARQKVATVLRARGEFGAARKLHERVLAALTSTLAQDHPDVQRARGCLAMTLAHLGEWRQVQDLQQRMVEALTPATDDGHPDIQRARSNLAVAQAMTGADSLPMLRDLLRGLQGRRRTLATRSVLSPLDPWEPAIPEVFRAACGFMPLVGDREALVRGTLRVLIAIQPMSLGGRGSRALLAGMSSEERSRLRSLDIGLRGVPVQLSAGTDSARWLERRDQFQSEIDEIVRGVPGSEFLQREVTENDLGAALAAHQVVVAFIRYSPLAKPGKTTGAPPGAERYGAFVVRPGGASSFVDVCDGKGLERAAETYLGHVRGNRSPDGAALGRLLMAPLIGALGEATEILCTLDGAVHGIPLEALAWESGALGDRFRVLVYPALRDICVSLPGELRPPSLLALGDPAFDDGPPGVVKGAGAFVSRRDGIRNAPFAASPASAEALRDIAALFQERFGADSAPEVLLGKEASRGRLLRSIGTRRYVHFATHAWTESPPSSNRPGLLTDPFGDVYGVIHKDLAQVLSPWSRCGIALAGANLPPDAASRVEGRLSGEDVATLDLEGCELVVVAGCGNASGPGERLPEAVFALQSALHAAGARSVVTSLWEVPEGPTQALMMGFYRNLWMEGLPKHEALRRAKSALRQATAADGKPRYTLRDWAGWVLTGDPR